MTIPFDSQKIFYRSPFGAVEQDTKVYFRVLVPRKERSRVTELCVKYDYDYNWEYHKLIWCGNFDDERQPLYHAERPVQDLHDRGFSRQKLAADLL